MARIDLSEFEMELIQPLLPNTSRGAARGGGGSAGSQRRVTLA